MDPVSTTGSGYETTRGEDAAADAELGLVVVWSAEEPARIGEIAWLGSGGGRSPGKVLGRSHGGDVLSFQRQRPGHTTVTGPIGGGGISRRQLTLRVCGDAIAVERVGRCPLRVNGDVVDRAVVVAGDTLHLRGQLLLLVIERERDLPAYRSFAAAALGAFGWPDRFGILGESAACHRLRDDIAFVAGVGGHVLVRGESGTGKELATRAVHALSSRAAGPMVARNAATFPEELIDVELFGNVKNFPNPGMVEREGLIGRAHLGTLFLDEIGELPPRLQAHLLRVLDSHGDYQRLGESCSRRADIRLIGATHRDFSSLRHDLLARMPLRIVMPSLAERREDIPLLARQLLRRIAREHPTAVQPFHDGDDVRVSVGLIERLVRHHYVGNVRELESLLWQALQTSPGDKLVWNDSFSSSEPSEESSEPRPQPRPEVVEPARRRPPTAITADMLRGAIAEAGGNLAEASRALGLPSRFALYRLLRKHGIAVEAARPQSDVAPMGAIEQPRVRR